jgi:predicted dinucleotide-binding enzyme
MNHPAIPSSQPFLWQEERVFLQATGAFLTAAAAPFPAFAQTAASGPRVKIGVIGSGRIGGTIGTLWVKAGHEVAFSSRHPENLKELVEKLGPLARAVPVAEAAAFGEAVLIAVPYNALPQVGRDNAAALKGKLVLDSGNAVAARDGDIVKEVQENGIGETSAKYLPGARLVRAFNSFGFRNFETQAHREGERLGVPIAGDDAEALKLAEKLVRDAGFEPVAVPLVRAKEFAPGGPLFQQALPVSELKRRLGVS